jgi:protein O-mannosyl-transferase
MNKFDDFSIVININVQINKKYVSAFILLFVFLVLVYSNSFDCSWHFDDYINIVGNSSIQITDLSWQSIQKGLYGVFDAERWQRPVSYFTFAINYYFGGFDLLGYHIVNLSIHCLTAFFLFLFVYHTLNLPLIRDQYEKNAYSIALLSALLWAINPVQVSAVTYIVQRMASMVALFYIMAMFFYLKGRTSEIAWKRMLFFVLSFFFGALAVGTKENAAMLPISIFLFDLLLIRGITMENIKRALPYGITAAIAFVAIGLLYIGDLSTINSDYQIRPFTMFERILTQPRVLVFYMSLLIYPLTSRMMLIHDIDYSKSFIEPWTTMPAIMIIILIIAAALWIVRKSPLIAYCIFFFFLNHLIEGSFIALELVFEHRNYLPSMFFFLPIGIIMINGLQYFSQKKFIFSILVIAMISLMIIQGVTVYIQNNIYKDEISLWTDNRDKAPRLHVVQQSLAASYFLAGRFDEAFNEATLALASYEAANLTRKSKTHGMLGEYYFLKGDEEGALTHYKESLRFDPTFHTGYRRIAEIMVRINRLQEAEQQIRKGLSVKPDSYAYHAILARILLKKGEPDGAIKEARISLALNGNQSEPYAVMSDAYRVKKNDAIANHFRKVVEAMGLNDKYLHPVPLFTQAAS